MVVVTWLVVAAAVVLTLVVVVEKAVVFMVVDEVVGEVVVELGAGVMLSEMLVQAIRSPVVALWTTTDLGRCGPKCPRRLDKVKGL